MFAFEDAVDDGREPKVRPAAEAVTTTAAPATATAPTARPAARRWRILASLLNML
jgi:hypothetical protein